MPLKLTLKPGEKFVLNGAVLANGDKRASLIIQNKACVLREKDIMQAEDATTPARRIYFPIMMMYLDNDEADVYYSHFALRMTEFMDAIRERKALATCVEISRDRTTLSRNAATDRKIVGPIIPVALSCVISSVR